LNNPDALAVMAGFGYSVERLEKELQAVNEVENLHSKQLSEKSGAQQATIERDEAFDELCKWYGSFRAIARSN
jgi:NADH/NAD ratio-sensing transcriptional regulator Rex